MRRRLPLAVAGWLVTGALATGAGVAVISYLGEPLTASAHRPLSSAEVRQALARLTPSGTATVPGSPPATAVPSATPVPSGTALPSATPVPSGSAAPTPPPAGPSGRSRVIGTAGGNVIARCDGGLVTLRAWSPAQGFRVDDVERGPAVRARVEFEADDDDAGIDDLRIEVWCPAGGSPVHRISD
ncbi:septum formation initiator [Planomonospora venezuelensis]|uniref:Septum formation initiator n=1 Tax=Planomonospora venezuelensis TaxID=1999 RepID=A0A841D7T3_PLAVE|nr:septum formation initiator [Planomonospora venezuelensis]MBB5964554.1 hypothetical protein [Planomonospora venezuelensis]GIN02851.1 hypothetical protein Pve01_45090 [Planomonospora venezuelensis]